MFLPPCHFFSYGYYCCDEIVFVLNSLNYSPLREAMAGIQTGQEFGGADAETMAECFLPSQASRLAHIALL